VVDETRLDELPISSPAVLTLTAPYSRLNQIITDAPPPTVPAHIFGTEPTHTWCYYFQKAELARQIGDWEQVAALGDTAIDAGIAPANDGEWLVFIEGYAAVGRCDDARALSNNLTQKRQQGTANDLLGECSLSP
jgi:hypothetical protein